MYLLRACGFRSFLRVQFSSTKNILRLHKCDIYSCILEDWKRFSRRTHPSSDLNHMGVANRESRPRFRVVNRFGVIHGLQYYRVLVAECFFE